MSHIHRDESYSLAKKEIINLLSQSVLCGQASKYCNKQINVLKRSVLQKELAKHMFCKKKEVLFACVTENLLERDKVFVY